MSYISVESAERPFKRAPFSEEQALPGGFMRVKRAFDIILAVLLLPLVALVCLIVALLNTRYNPGPLFFVQTRIGQNETPFRMIKLRTMVGENAAARFATDESHRITRMGAFMRSKRVDELPQVFNILMGQMSFIGPRPEQPGFYAEFAEKLPGYAGRQQVRPGISGLAQVKSGYADDAEGTRTKLRYDLHYIRNMGVSLELYVFFRTFQVLVTGFGAR